MLEDWKLFNIAHFCHDRDKQSWNLFSFEHLDHHPLYLRVFNIAQLQSTFSSMLWVVWSPTRLPELPAK